MPEISIIVPAYKVEKYIHRCIDSILNQTFRDFELILVDDGSPDNCGAICDEYAAKDNRVVVIHQENGGLSAARNAGIDWAFANSDSQWLSFIDSDDWVHPEYLQRLLDAAVEHNVSVSICGYAQTNGEEPEIAPESLTCVLWHTEDFYVKHNVNATIACGKLYRKECFREIRYPVGKLHEDEFTTYKILFSLEKIAVIPAELYAYFFNPDGIAHSSWTMKRMAGYDAREAQIQYFREHGFHQAEHLLCRIYVCSIYEKITTLSKNRKENIDLIIALKQRKKKNFRNFCRKLDPNDQLDAWVLTQIYPKTMWVYWHIKALLNKFKR